MRQAVILVDDIDQHGIGCECGLCNVNGKSYGASVYLVPENITIQTEGEAEAVVASEEAAYRPYGATEATAQQMAEALCSHEGLTVFQEIEEVQEHGIEVIDQVNFKVNTEELLSYEFETKEDIFIEGPDDECSLFRFHFYKKNQTVEVYVANSEDFDVHEEVAYLFDTDSLLLYFEGMDNAGMVPDETEEYKKYYEEDDEPMDVRIGYEFYDTIYKDRNDPELLENEKEWSHKQKVEKVYFTAHAEEVNLFNDRGFVSAYDVIQVARNKEDLEEE